MSGQLERNKPKGTQQQQQQQREASGGIRGSVRRSLFRHMLDAVDGSFKILICDAAAAAVLNSCVRMHELMEHGVTLLEDLMTARQPIINSPALYFFTPDDATVGRVMEDWSVKEPYKEAHIFALSTTPERYVQQLAESRLAPKVKSFKDMLLDFSTPETLVFHLNMQNEFAQLLSPVVLPAREAALDIAASRLVSVFHALNNGVPVIRFQNRSGICPGFAKIFFEKLAKLCHDVPDFKKGGDGGDNPLLIILDRSFDTVAPLVHERTYQCLLEDLMPLENNMYEQTFKNRLGADSKRQFPVDEEDPYWCRYRHRFFAHCLEELPAALKKLHSENPSLAQGMGQNANVAELGGAVRALPEFQEKQAKLSMHIDICTKVMAQYRERRLAEVCEVEQDIAAERKPFKTNLENVRRLLKEVTVPQEVRLRLLLLFVAASNTSEFTEVRKQQLIQESGMAGDVNRIASLEHLTSRVGRVRREAAVLGQEMNGKQQTANTPGTNAASGGDPFLNQAYLVMEAAVKNTLSAADFPTMNSPNDAGPTAASGGVMRDAPFKKRTLRAGLSLVALKQDGVNGQMGANSGVAGGGGGGYTSTGSMSPAVSPRGGGKGVSLLDLGNSGGIISLQSTQRIVVFVLGGVTCSEMRAAYEVSKALGREVIIGGTSLLRPDEFVRELNNLR
ncbi:syntaxin binding protein 1 [Trypanosoma grayi]|uniref:syntaxin binding protein 1 n=1 Tax=Trypanosoma grayi TaxID=71804 RepID=UPI0004F473D3|nr:syntaxin binding protein 1 [Trypanosoma grayi]KEG07651.1 syntaxin binding protein 1 [Trypanosoma grayi]